MRSADPEAGGPFELALLGADFFGVPVLTPPRGGGDSFTCIPPGTGMRNNVPHF
jgi:hypothetical protein